MSTLTTAARRLRSRYAEGLPAKWRVVEEALASLRGGDTDAEDTLRRVAHQVRGSAASFGFVLVDKAAYRVEHAEDREHLVRAAAEFIHALRTAYEAESTPMTRVLLIDDDPNIGMMFNAMLAEDNVSITQVTTAAAAIEELEARAWKAIFIDLVLPDADGRTLLSQLRALPLHRETSVVVLSAKTGSLVKNECAVYGIDDFIEKPIDPSTFAVRVGAMLERARAHQTITQNDPLTGLPNRLGFRQALERLAKSQRETLTLAVIEVRHVEELIQTAGQDAGDEAISFVAKLLRSSIRDGDLLGRWGGEEFLVAMPGMRALEAIELLGSASEILREWALGSEGTEPLSLSAGVTELDDSESLDFGLLRADQLLRRVKRGDRGWCAHTLESSADGRPKLLVAEDDAAVAALLVEDLSDDYDVTYVADGGAAVEAASLTTFDLVLLDYQMPHLDGVEVVRRLRERPEYADRPILLLTAIGSDAAIEAAFEAGADDYIAKPHRRRALLARLSRHLGRAPAPVEPGAPQRDDVGESGPRPTEAVETDVTALFCDISGFSNIAAELAPRELLALLNTYFPIIVEVVKRLGGTLEKYIGDAVLAIWGAPEASDDDVVRALQAAVEIQGAVAQLRDARAPDLRVHIGLHSGPVVAANIGPGELGQYATVGDTTNVASRVCDLAGPDEIVLSEQSVAALAGRSSWPLDGPERAELRGRDQAVDVYRLRWRGP